MLLNKEEEIERQKFRYCILQVVLLIVISSAGDLSMEFC